MQGICNGASVVFSGIRTKISKWWSSYFSWSWSALLVSGLYFGYAFVEYSFLGFLIILVQGKTGSPNLRRNAIILNAQDIFQGLLASFLLFALGYRIRPFYMILSTYGGFFLGSLILWVTPTLSIGMIYFALIPLAVAEAGEGFTNDFLIRCLQLEKGEQDEETIDTRRFICRFIARFFGATIATLWISNLGELSSIFMSSAIVTGMTYLLFCFGFKYYYKCLNQSSSTERQDSGQSQVNRQKDHNNGKRELCLFLRKLPLWFPFLSYYVVEAAGSTFFMNQTARLDFHILGNFRFGPSSLLVVQKCSTFIASRLADYLIKKLRKEHNQERRARLVRMCLGMGACSGCCVVAWHFETHRLDLLNPPNIASVTIPMSTLLLAPQFSLLGFADGLIEDGMDGFFHDHAPASMHRFAMAFTKTVDAGGKLIAVVFILALKNWIGEDVDESRLDSYYLMLAILVSCALPLFIILAIIYDWEIKKKEVDEKLDDNVETGPEQNISNADIPPTSEGSTLEESISNADIPPTSEGNALEESISEEGVTSWFK